MMTISGQIKDLCVRQNISLVELDCCLGKLHLCFFSKINFILMDGKKYE